LIECEETDPDLSEEIKQASHLGRFSTVHGQSRILGLPPKLNAFIQDAHYLIIGSGPLHRTNIASELLNASIMADPIGIRELLIREHREEELEEEHYEWLSSSARGHKVSRHIHHGYLF
jgi:hypothetical protein